MGGDVGDVDPEPDPALRGLGGDGIVEVAGGRRVDGEGGEPGEVAALAALARRRLGGFDRLSLEIAGEAPAHPAVEHQRLDHVDSNRRVAQLANDPGTPGAAGGQLDQGHPAGGSPPGGLPTARSARPARTAARRQGSGRASK